jgi:hypothetical protein
VQLIEQRLRLFQVERIEPLGKPAVDRIEKLAGLIPLVLIAPQEEALRLSRVSCPQFFNPLK